MGSSKALLLATLVAVGASSAAFGADLLPPPPPLEPVPVDVGGGWYLRGDVGVGATQLTDWRASFAPVDLAGNPNQTVSTPGYISLGDQAFAGAGFGYQFNNWFRVDFTGEYRTEANYRATQLYTFPTGPGAWAPVAGDGYFGNLGSAVFLANGYVDLGTWYGITPFVGGGVGVANTWMKGFSDGPALGFAADTNKTNFAWAVMGGLALNVTNNLKLELGYRYLDMGGFQTNPIVCIQAAGCALERHNFNLASHDVRLGLRYNLGGFGPAPALAPIGPFAGPGPLIRKY